MIPTALHSIAPVAAESMLSSFALSTVLAVAVWLLLRLLPRRDSRTSFAVWFATLLLTAFLPLPGLYSSSGPAAGGGSTHAAITLSSSWAVGIVSAWVLVSLFGLMRVVLALVQVRRLRSQSAVLDSRTLGPELSALINDFRRSRSVELLVSKQLEVPTAIGFFKPAIVLPEWLVRGMPAGELKYILLHELAHLRRRDDWTNLAQQVLKAFLFFIPSVWWIERKLSLDREMACDDAVLAQSGTPHAYAECLARVAEKSFLRRQLAMAQAAVARLRQLTVRVAKILDPARPQASQLWKPAVPAVVVIAGLCVFSASRAPLFISFADSAPEGAAVAVQQPVENGQATHISTVASAIPAPPSARAKLVAAKLSESSGVPAAPRVRAWDASLQASAIQKKPALRQRPAPSRVAGTNKLVSTDSRDKLAMLEANAQPSQPSPQYVTVREEYFMVVRQGPLSIVQESWQVHFVEINVVPVQPAQKQVPRKI